MLMIAVLEELMYSKNTVVQGSPWWLNGGQWWATQETRVPSRVWEDPMCLGREGNGTPLQYSCLENPRDGGSLVGCRLWGRTESDTTEATQQQQQQQQHVPWGS